jgi:protein-histidine pros-kinase
MDSGKHLTEALLAASSDALFALDTNNRIVAWNNGAQRLFGCSHHTAIGSVIDAILGPNEPFVSALVAARSKGRAEYATTRHGADGLLELEGTATLSNTGDGLVIVSERDVTTLRRLQAVHADEARFRGLLEAAPDAIIITSSDGRIILVNHQAERLFGYDRDELTGHPIEILVPDRFRARHPQRRDGYFDSPQPRPMGAGLDLFGRRKDGTEFAAEISLSPIRTPEGVLGAAAVRDVTDRKRDYEEQNQRMAEANRLKSEFLANMSHELRTPLNAIIGFAALLHSGRAGALAPDHHEYVGDILTSSRHLLQLINDVLDLAKVESGRMDFRVEEVDLAKIVAEVKDTVRGLASERRVKLVVSVHPSVTVANIAPRAFKQVLYNYLSNAIKFTHEGGQVDIIVSPGDSPDTFRLDVRDTGIGIAARDIPLLFNEFRQIDAGPNKRYQGTGLGLALTKRIVEAQGGSVGVVSETDRGSTFSAILPLRPLFPHTGEASLHLEQER